MTFAKNYLIKDVDIELFNKEQKLLMNEKLDIFCDENLVLTMPLRVSDEELVFKFKLHIDDNFLKEFFRDYYSQILDGLVDEFNDLILIADAKGVVLAVNNSSETIMGVKAGNIIGMTLMDLEGKGIIIPSAGLRVLNSGCKETVIQTTACGNCLEVTGVPVYDDKGQLTRVVCRSRDLSSKEKIKKKLDSTKLLYDTYQNDLAQMEVAALQENLIFKSKAMADILDIVHKVARVNSTVLLQGESGVGKEVIAKIIHQLSDCRDYPFIKINCGAIPETLFESELFGYEAGAFTGAKKNGKPGLFELADHGTLFLDEIAEMPLNLQVKLLRVIQEQEVSRLGSTKTKKVKVRLISATNRNLLKMVKRGTFREDLFYRLNVIPIFIPPLKERKEDIEELTKFFLYKFNSQYNLQKDIAADVIEFFKNYEWTGNVREMQNVIEGLVILAASNVINIEDLPQTMFTDYILPVSQEQIKEEKASSFVSEAVPLGDVVAETEKTLLEKLVRKGSTTREIAKILKINQSTVVRKLRKYNLNR